MILEESGRFLMIALQSLPEPSRAYQCLLESSRAFQCLPEPSKAYQSLPEPSTAYQYLPIPTRVFQSLPDPSNAYQSIPMPSRDFQNLPMPTKAFQCHTKIENGWKWENERSIELCQCCYLWLPWRWYQCPRWTKWSSLASMKLSLKVLENAVTLSRMYSKQASFPLRVENRAIVENSSNKDFQGHLLLPKPVYSLICQLSKLPQPHVGNNLSGQRDLSLQPVASLGECRMLT